MFVDTFSDAYCDMEITPQHNFSYVFMQDIQSLLDVANIVLWRIPLLW